MSYLLYIDRQFFDNDGNPLALGKVYTRISGTSTPKASYTDSTGNSSHTNPVILDADGRADIWLKDDALYRIIVTDADDNPIGDTIDSVSGVGLALSAFEQLNSDLDTNGYNIIGTGSINIEGDIVTTGNYTLNDLTISGTLTSNAMAPTTLTTSSTATFNGLVTSNANLYVKNGAAGPGTIRVYEDSDNGTNYSSITSLSALASDAGILTLPTVATQLPTSLPSSTSKPILMTTAGQLNPHTAQIGMDFLGTVAVADGAATAAESTTILQGYNAYRLISACLVPWGTANNDVYLQLYVSAAYVTTTYFNQMVATDSTSTTFDAALTSGIHLSDAKAGYSPSIYNLDITISGVSTSTITVHGNASGTNQTSRVSGYRTTLNIANLTGFKILSSGGTVTGSAGNILVYGLRTS